MSEETDVKAGEEEVIQTEEFEDNVTDDHQAGIGASADENESHQLDIDDYDEVIENADKHAEGEAAGEPETTDEPKGEESSESTEEEEEEAKVPLGRLNKVIGERNTERDARAEDRVTWNREKGVLEGRLQALERSRVEPEVKPEPELSPFDQVMTGEPQEIIDALQTNPAEFFQNLKASAEATAQAKIEAKNEEKAYYDNLRTGLDSFAADHDNFRENLEVLGNVVDSDPIHNLVSAFAYEIEIPALKTAHEEALAKATGDLAASKAEGIKIGKAEALKDFQAKGNAAVLDGSQSVDGAQVSPQPELEDTEKSGGIRAILTKHLADRRAGKG
jgi:hypothetical protein